MIIFGQDFNILISTIMKLEIQFLNLFLVILNMQYFYSIIPYNEVREMARLIKDKNISITQKYDKTHTGIDIIGTTGQYVNRIIKKQDGVVNKTFVQMLEALGYDIELTYVKKKIE